MQHKVTLALLLLFSISLPLAGQSRTRPSEAQDVVVRITTNLVQIDALVTKGSIVRSFIYLNATDLEFSPANDRRETSLEIHGVVFGDNGSIVEQVKHSAVLSLRESEYKQAMRDGLRLRFDMPAKSIGPVAPVY